ncbi:MAG TPA: ADOP family duplicated permease, partial [Gemmatimonadaceae bacterium]|nr:ADOP family duplicated permease [Gemmatimonadaceae bacterium]
MKRVFWMPSSRATVRRDVDAEVAFHLEGRIDELVAQGLSREEAEREAVGRFGDQARVRAQLERIDEVARGRQARSEWLGDLARDVRFAVRSLVQHPMYALAVIATLALGIGANTSIFSVADALLFRPPPYPRPSELVSVWGATGGEYFGVRDRTRSFASVAAYSVSQMNIGDETNSERAEGAEVSENLFATFGVRPARGRGFSRGSNAVGAPREVILSDACWRARFGSDTNIVGRTILVDGVSRSVVGVMPEPFHFPSLGTQLWIQSVFDPTQTGNHWGWGKYRLIARMNRGVTLGAARADLKSITPFLRDENPVWNPGPGYGADATVTLLQATLAGPVRTTLLVLLAVVFALLLIACANVANLVLVRSIGRASEFAVRTALGCSRGRMLRQLLTESLVLAGAGGAGGVALAWAGVRALVSALPPQIPHTAPITVDARVLAFTASLTIVSAIAFGLMPALRAVRSTPGSAVPRSRGASRDAGHRRLADALTVVQLALAVVLVAGSGLLLRSFDALRRVDPGFAADHVVAARVTLSGGAYREPAKQSAFLDALLGRVQSAPGVTSVAAVNRPPLRGPVYGSAIRVEGQFEDVKRALPVIEHQQSVTPGYFATMGIPVVRGREFTSGDRADTPPVAIISASVVRRFWPNQDPVGKRIGMPFESPWITIVGVAADVKQDSLSGAKEE